MSKDINSYIPNIKGNNEVLSLLSKLVTDNKSINYDFNTNTITSMLKITESIIDKSKRNEDLLRLFPDIEKCSQILVSSIVCPNDLISTNINFKINNIPTDLNTVIINFLKDYIINNYKIEDNLYNIVKETLFINGAYCELIVPENVLDSYIKKVEDNGMSIGNKYTISHESIEGIFKNSKEKNNITYTEDDLNVNIEINPYNILKYNKNIKDMKDIIRNEYYNTSNEDLNVDDIFTNITHQKDKSTIIFNNKTEREPVTKPMVMKVSSESIIPIFIKNDPSIHIGYFLITDENYSPIRLSDMENEYNYYKNNSSGTLSSFLINKARESLYGMIKEDVKYDKMEELYSHLLEYVITDKINKNGINSMATLGDINNIYKVMFSRTIQNKKTKLIYLPEDMVAYYAHSYRKNGTGKSMLESNHIIYSFRAILLYARIMAEVRNSINTTTFKVRLDEKDRDPRSTAESIVSSVLESSQVNLPFGLTKPNHLSEWAHMLGKEFYFQHPNLPNIEIDKDNNGNDKHVPDTNLDDMLFEQTVMNFGLTADIIKSGFENDFATTIVTKNLLFAKTIKTHHIWLNKAITNHIKKLSLNDPNVRNNINKILKENKHLLKDDNKIKEEDIVLYIIDNITCFLPEPDVTDANSLSKMFKDEMDNAQDFIQKILTDELLPDELAGASSEHIRVIREMLMGLYAIDWANKNGLYKNITELLFSSKEQDKNKLTESYNDIRENLANNIVNLLRNSVKFKERFENRIENLEEELDIEEADDKDEKIKELTEKIKELETQLSNQSSENVTEVTNEINVDREVVKEKVDKNTDIEKEE